jgi:hypothetical protein
MQNVRRPADAERRQHTQIGELVRQHDRRITEPQLDLHELPAGNLDAADFRGAEDSRVPRGCGCRIADDEMRRDRVQLVQSSTSS